VRYFMIFGLHADNERGCIHLLLGGPHTHTQILRGFY